MFGSMRIMAILLAIAGTSSTVLAQGVDTRRMTCQALQAYVFARGATLLHYGPGLYQRVVTDRGQCLDAERIDPAMMPTLDTPSCPAGFYCAVSNNRNR